MDTLQKSHLERIAEELAQNIGAVMMCSLPSADIIKSIEGWLNSEDGNQGQGYRTFARKNMRRENKLNLGSKVRSHGCRTLNYIIEGRGSSYWKAGKSRHVC